MSLPDYLTTAEAAEYLRLKERKVYDLVGQGVIPCVRVTGKLLFPRQRIDLWLMNHLEGDEGVSAPTPPVLVGSQDPLLEWAVKESNAELAMLCQGSGDGVQRLVDGRAMVAGMHIWHAQTERYNDPVTLGLSGMRDRVWPTASPRPVSVICCRACWPATELMAASLPGPNIPRSARTIWLWLFVREKRMSVWVLKRRPGARAWRLSPCSRSTSTWPCAGAIISSRPCSVCWPLPVANDSRTGPRH